MPISYNEFVNRVIARAFPDGEPDNLVEPHRQDIRARLIKLQQYCPEYRALHIDIIPHCDTYFWCGATVVDAPPGIIKKLYTVIENKYCCPVYYNNIRDFNLFIEYNRTLSYVPACIEIGTFNVEPLPINNEITKWWRANHGYYCIKDRQIFITPFINETEAVIIEWTGIKRKWEANDLVGLPFLSKDNDEIDDLVIMVADYVLGNHIITYVPTLAEQGIMLIQKSDAELAELIHKVRTLQYEESESTVSYFNNTPSYYTCSVSREFKETGMRVAFVGDLQHNVENKIKVSQLIKGFNPDYVFLGGDLWNDDNGGTSLNELDTDIAYYYGEYIFPYNGFKNIARSSDNKLYVCIGNHDIYPNGRFLATSQYFNIPVVYPNISDSFKGYYIKLINNIAFVFLFSDHAGGIAKFSEQYIEIRQIMSMLSFEYSIFVMHKPPYSSYESHTDARWNFNMMKCKLVLSGHKHCYERHIVDNLTYITCGTGGANLLPKPSNMLSSVVKGVYGKHGALRLELFDRKITGEFYDINNKVHDAFTITW